MSPNPRVPTCVDDIHQISSGDVRGGSRKASNPAQEGLEVSPTLVCSIDLPDLDPSFTLRPAISFP